MIMDIDSLKEEVISMLYAFGLRDFKELSVTGGSSIQFVVKEFGLVISASKTEDIAIVRNKISDQFKDWRWFFITTDDDLIYKKDEMLFELMRCGYIKWLRLEYNRTFNTAILHQDFGSKIIKKRLEIWNKKPKYNFLIIDNEDALKHSFSYVLSLDPGFFDYMPEIE